MSTRENELSANSGVNQTGRPARVHLVALCGSMRGERSYTRKALTIALAAARQAGATTDLIDLSTLDLPFCGTAQDKDDNPQIVELRSRIEQGQGILLGSPEYHNSFSGVLKNALDLLSSDQTRGKIFGLLGVAGGSTGAINTLGHLRVVVRGIGGWSLPVQISIPNAGKAFAGEDLIDPDMQHRVQAFGQEMVRFTRLHSLVPTLEHLLIETIDENV